MKGRFRVFKAGALHHIYQRTVGGYLIFYSVRDFIVFFTLFCTVARKRNIQVLGLCLMYDHLHVLISAPSRIEMSSFVRDYTSQFVKNRNAHYSRKGQFFKHRFGSAPKTSDKKARTAISYLYNNPVEKSLCNNAEDYRWNFLKYAHCPNPYSEPLKLSLASRHLRRAINEVNAHRDLEQPLSYSFIDKVSKECSAVELKQLTDFIITAYNCIDYPALESYYDDFSKLLIAINSNTGSEYQIKEIVTADSDKVYGRLARVLKKMTGYSDMTKVLSLPDEDKRRIAWILSAETNATPRQISKYLHLSLDNPE